MEKAYTLKFIITEDKQTKAFRFGDNWYNMDERFCPCHTAVNNTKDLSKAVKFKTKEEAEKHRDMYFNKGFYEVIKIKKN